MRTASRELLASRAEVWAFFAEPYHLSDWWPGIVGVEPDRKGFAPGARWKVRLVTSNVVIGRRVRESLVLVREIDSYERWSWHLLARRLDVELRLRALDEGRTHVECATSGRRAVGARALARLYDLVQTAASL